MLGPLVKAQLVAFLTKKLLESKLFVGAVHSLHDNVTRVQQGAYDTLLQATEDFDRKHPPPHLKHDAQASTHRPRADEPLKDQNAELKRLIEKMRSEMKEEERRR
ncbi:hypothetical protein JCM6882_009676 [Rhodosporidiobolus microsporus]